MATFRTLNEIILSYIEYLRLVKPDLDTKPGTVARDVFIDAPAIQISELYNELRNISSLQSLFSATGNDLARLGSNFGLQKLQGSYASGTAVFTTNNLDVDISIPIGTVVTARNGVTFRTTTSTVMSASNPNVYAANASRISTDLQLAGITDQYAVEVNCEAITVGTAGNIGRFSLNSQNVSGISNITNLISFSGGSGIESDSEFRSRILSIFAGSNTGTALGYENVINTDSNVQDVVVITPGDPLLIRDGTQVSTDSSGNLIVSDPGSGGKVDIYILGSNLVSAIDTFIYNDKSGVGDPTDVLNDFILGQQGEDTTLDSSQRRLNLLESGNVPQQPVDSIISVSGSISGPNFVAKYTNNRGEIKGNYELVKDTGSLSGSPFGFDKISWISDEIDLDDEDLVKDVFNGSDELSFSDVNSIRSVIQDVLVSNENPTVSTSDRSVIYLKHKPIRTVSRITNTTTGERYVISNQNPDGTTGELNETGRIIISGSTLPVGTDVLQVDYIWVNEFDRFYHYDNLEINNSFRTTQDSVDWSYGNLVKNEESQVVDDGTDKTVSVTDPIFKVLAINSYKSESSSVSNGTIVLSETINNIIDIKRNSDGAEIYNTDASDGTLSGTTIAILPNDTLASDGDSVTVRYNASDIFTSDAYGDGSFANNLITLPEDTTYDGYVLVTYVANVLNMIPSTTIDSLPIFDSDNNFIINGSTAGYQPTSNVYDSFGFVTKNLRKGYSNARITLSSAISSGNIVVAGTTFNKVTDDLVTVTTGNGYDINFRTSILNQLNTTSIPTGVRVAKIQSIERVNINSSGIITSVDNVYDVVNYRINDNSYDTETALSYTSLDNFTISLPRTSDNTSAILTAGDVLRITYYYINANDSERVFFSRNGTQSTNKMFYNISKIYVSSGFLDTDGNLTGNIAINNFIQPTNNSTYLVDYSYSAPKENERITVTFNTNDLIRSSTLAVEEARPITSDVLVKEAIPKDVDLTAQIVVLTEFQNSSQTVLQNSIDSVSEFLNSDTLGTTVDASDIINNLYTVDGIDRVQIINFSSGSSGNKASITANKNEYLRAGTINISVESR